MFFKFEFFKAYNKIDKVFLFDCMGKLGIPKKFVSITKNKFIGAKASVNVNGKLSQPLTLK
jgi:hypothetical protein